MNDAAFHAAQLRHAYEHLVNQGVWNEREFADGLIAPTIRYLESLASADTRRMAETGTGSVRSTSGAVPEGQTPNTDSSNTGGSR
jgi:hypothetical protein